MVYQAGRLLIDLYNGHGFAYCTGGRNHMLFGYHGRTIFAEYRD